MHRLFTKKSTRPAIHMPALNATIGRVKSSYRVATNYYREKSVYIDANHLLMKVLYSLPVKTTGTPMDAYIAADRNVDKICSAVGITTDSISGSIHANTFYTNECVVYHAHLKEPYEVTNWDTEEAVKPLTHPHTSMECVHAHRLGGTGISVVAIDIPLLAGVFSNWLNKNSDPSIEFGDTVQQFISKIVMPNMFASQIDIAMRNRLVYYYNDEPVPVPTLKPPMGLVRQDVELERIYKTILAILNNNAVTVDEATTNIPMIFSQSYWDAVPKDVTSVSVVSYWVGVLVYLEWLYPIAVVIDDIKYMEDGVKEKMLVAARYIRGRVQESRLPQSYRMEYLLKMDYVMKKLTGGSVV